MINTNKIQQQLTTRIYNQQSRTIKQRTDNFMKSISQIQAKQLNPQKLLLLFINLEHKQIQCQQLQQTSKHKVEKLNQQIKQLRQKIHDKVLRNKNVIELVKKRDDRVIQLERLLTQRNNNQKRLTINELKQKYNIPQSSLDTKKLHLITLNSLFHPRKGDNFRVIKQNLRYYRVSNKQLQSRILQLRNRCQQLQRKNRMMTEQQQIEQRINLINIKNKQPLNNDYNNNNNKECLNKTYISQSEYNYDHNYSNKNYLNIKVNYNNSNGNRNNISRCNNSQLWLNKIDQIKQKYLVNNNCYSNCHSKSNCYSNCICQSKCNCLNQYQSNKNINKHISPRLFSSFIQNNNNQIYTNHYRNKNNNYNKNNNRNLYLSPTYKQTSISNKLSRVKSLNSTRIN